MGSIDRDGHAARHILTFIETFNGGGVERAALRLAGAWLAAGRRVTLLAGERQGPLIAELPPGAALVPVPRGAFARLAVPRALLHRLAPDVIFCPGIHYTSTALHLRLLLGRGAPPIVAKISNGLHRRDLAAPLRAAHRLWHRRLPGFIDAFVAMSAGTRAEAISALAVDPARVALIPNPPASPRVLSLPQGLPKAPMLVGIGRLEPQKRWDRLIAALPRLAHRDCVVVILGEGSQRAALEAQARALGVAERVLMPGYAYDPAPWLRRARACVLTSDFEGVPNVLHEALALGTPVVSTDSSVAVREIVATPALGTVVPRNDPAALVAALDTRLAPDARRPEPVPPPGSDSGARYLALFDALAGADAPADTDRTVLRA